MARGVPAKPPTSEAEKRARQSGKKRRKAENETAIAKRIADRKPQAAKPKAFRDTESRGRTAMEIERGLPAESQQHSQDN